MEIALLLQEPERCWARRPPAAEGLLDELARIAGPDLPREYLDLLRCSNGGEGPLALPPLWFVLFDAQLTASLNGDPKQRERQAGCFVFGSNGDMESIAFDMRTAPWPIIMYDSVSGPKSAIAIAPDVSHFVAAIGVSAFDDERMNRV